MSKSTITATTPTTVRAKPGEVVELGVKVGGTDPVRLYADGVDSPLQTTSAGEGEFRALFAVGPGVTRVTAHAGAARPVEFTITAEPAAKPAADIEKE